MTSTFAPTRTPNNLAGTNNQDVLSQIYRFKQETQCERLDNAIDDFINNVAGGAEKVAFTLENFSIAHPFSGRRVHDTAQKLAQRFRQQYITS